MTRGRSRYILESGHPSLVTGENHATESATVCQSPGNVQLNDAPPAVNFHRYGGYGLALGGGGILPGR